MERRVVFSGWLFPAFLLMPQLAVTLVFFFWPAAQAILQSMRREDAFGLSTQFVAAENFASALTNGASARRVVAVRGKGLDGPADEIKRLGSR